MSHRAAYQIETGVPRRVFGSKLGARQRIERESHALVVANTEGEAASGAPHQWWVTDLRRGRLSIYGGLFRFLDILKRRGVSLQTALMIPHMLEHYIRDTWDAPAPSPKSMPVRLLQTSESDKAA